MQMYLLTSDAVVEALIAQKNAGRDVKVILNASFPQGGNANQSAFDRLRGAGVNVVWAPSAFRFTHSKSVIVDGREVWIMTMNATASSPSRNREYLAVTRAKDEVEQAQRIFDADFANRIANADGTLVVAPTNAEQRLLALINSATRSVDVEAEALSDTGIVNALVRAADRGRTVRVVLSTDFSSPGEDQAIATLKRRGIPVVSLTEPYVHAKAIVADGERAYVGSINLTTNSMRNNRELGIITSQPAAVRKIVSTIASDFTAGTRL
jgi:phosphatidylserine/phosphatidylglycerophosphate/cardiolipin synthase-like enzyme